MDSYGGDKMDSCLSRVFVCEYNKFNRNLNCTPVNNSELDTHLGTVVA